MTDQLTWFPFSLTCCNARGALAPKSGGIFSSSRCGLTRAISVSMKTILFILLTSVFSSHAFGWGNIGHRVVGKIAESRLTPRTLAKVYELTGKETLADLANWPDWIKSDEKWTHASVWHYVSIPDGMTYEDITKNPNGDIVVAIQRFAKEVGDKALPKQKRWEALAFLVHLVGDIHQPLHVGRAEDQGGNGHKLTWFGSNTNLHEIWDEKLIEMEKMSYGDYTAFIDKMDRSRESVWAQAPISVWMEESMALRPLVYDNIPALSPEGTLPRYWEYKYYYKVSRTMNQRMLMAGVRLAALLEKHL